MKTFKLIVLSKGKKIEREVSQLVIDTEAGQLTILANHIPFITTIVPGVVEWTYGDKKEKNIFDKGILKVDREKVTIFAEYN